MALVPPTSVGSGSSSVSGRADLVAAGQGFGGTAWDPTANNTTTTIPTQDIVGTLVGFAAGDVVTNIHMAVGTAAVGATPTTVRVGITTAAGVLLAKSSIDYTAVGNFPVGLTTFALSAPLTIVTTGAYYVCFLKNGVFGATEPAFLIGNSGTASQYNAIGAGVRRVARQTGQTDLPAVSASVTWAAPSQAYRFAWS